MSEIESLGNSFYYAGLQNAQTNESLKNKKSEQSKKTSKSRFGQLLKTQEPQFNSSIELPEEIKSKTFEEAITYLKEEVELAGNDLSESVTRENIERYKKSVKDFVSFMIENNYEINIKRPRFQRNLSPINYFSNYNTTPRHPNPKVQVNIINKKLAELTRETLKMQANNLEILKIADEIRGLIVDLMSY